MDLRAIVQSKPFGWLAMVFTPLDRMQRQQCIADVSRIFGENELAAQQDVRWSDLFRSRPICVVDYSAPGEPSP
jgi:hypothetical protein